MISKASRGNRRSLGVLAAVFVILCFFAIFGMQKIHSRFLTESQAAQIMQAESAEQLAQTLAERVGMPESVPLSAAQIGRYYAVPKDLLESAAVFTSTTESALHEIAVFRILSKTEREMVIDAVNNRIASYTAAYNLVNAEKDMQNYYVEDGGDYIVLIIGVPYARASAALAEA